MQATDERTDRGEIRTGGNGTGASERVDSRRRLFMAGRVDGEVQQVRFASSIRAPIRGPWSLALVVEPA